MAKSHITPLPQPVLKNSMPLNEAIQKRRSIRHLSSKKLTLEQISQLLWATQGITNTNKHFRTAPSAGALYPLEVYVAKSDGLWQYHPPSHSLSLIHSKDIRAELAKAAYHQTFIAIAPIDIMITGIYKRENYKIR